MRQSTVIKRLLAIYKRRLQKKFGRENTFFEIRVKKQGDKFLVEGLVTTQKLKEMVLRIVGESGYASFVRNKIKVLSDYNNKMEIGWGRAISLINLYSKPGKEQIKRKSIATQILPDETFRVLKGGKGWYLVQTEDLALGWLLSDDLENGGELYLKGKSMKKSASISKKFQDVKRVIPGVLIDLSFSEQELDRRINKIASPFMGTPYIFGGRSPETGFDCSGFVQKIVYEVSGFLLPKNSRDQVKCGEVVNEYKWNQKALKVGDLVFIRADKVIPHIGIVVSQGILHSSGTGKMKVVIDNFEQIKNKKDPAYQWVRDFSRVIRIFILNT